jgi:hypothetical protein
MVRGPRGEPRVDLLFIPPSFRRTQKELEVLARSKGSP